MASSVRTRSPKPSVLSRQSQRTIDRTLTSLREFPALLQEDPLYKVSANIPPLPSKAKQGGTDLYRLNCDALGILLASAARPQILAPYAKKTLEPFEFWIDAHLARMETWGSEIDADYRTLDFIARNDETGQGLHALVTTSLACIYEQLEQAGSGMDSLLHYVTGVIKGKESQSPVYLNDAQKKLTLALEKVDDLITDLFRLIRPIQVFSAMQRRSGPYSEILDQIRKIDHEFDHVSMPSTSASSSLSDASFTRHGIEHVARDKLESPSFVKWDIRDNASLEVATESLEFVPPEAENSTSYIRDSAKTSLSIAPASAPQLGQQPSDAYQPGSYVLSLDGAGVRSYLSLLILKALMEKIEYIERNHAEGAAFSSFEPLLKPEWARNTNSGSAQSDANYLPCHYFDYISGCRTSALSAIMLSRLRMSVEDSIVAFREISERVASSSQPFSFHGLLRPMYSTINLEQALRRHLLERISSEVRGDGLMASNPLMCKTMIVASCHDSGSQSSRIYIFRSYKVSSFSEHQNNRRFLRNAEENHKIPIERVIRAAAAAPMYFGDMILGDRAFSDKPLGFSGNPSWETWNEISNSAESGDSSIRFLLSIGTGRGQQQQVRSIFEPSTRDRLPGLQYFRQAKLIHKILVLSLNDPGREHEKLQSLAENARMFDSGGDRRFHYYRMNPLMETNEIKLYGWKKATKLRKSRSSGDLMDDVVKEYLSDPQVQQDLDRIAYQLVQHRRQRSKTRDWEAFATGTPHY